MLSDSLTLNKIDNMINLINGIYNDENYKITKTHVYIMSEQVNILKI